MKSKHKIQSSAITQKQKKKMYTDNDLKIDLIKYQNYGQFFFFFATQHVGSVSPAKD